MSCYLSRSWKFWVIHFERLLYGQNMFWTMIISLILIPTNTLQTQRKRIKISRRTRIKLPIKREKILIKSIKIFFRIFLILHCLVFYCNFFAVLAHQKLVLAHTRPSEDTLPLSLQAPPSPLKKILSPRWNPPSWSPSISPLFLEWTKSSTKWVKSSRLTPSLKESILIMMSSHWNRWIKINFFFSRYYPKVLKN